jgi:hypothetical protein
MKRCLLGLVVTTLACSGTEIGNPGKSTAGLQTVVFSSDPGVSIDSDTGELRVSEAWVKLSRITFTRSDDSLIGEIPIPLACNLRSPETCIPEPDFDAPDVCKIRLEVSSDVPLPADAPAELADAKVYIGGTRTDGAPFVITGDYDSVATLINPDKFDLQDSGPLVLSVDAGVWVKGNYLQTTEPDEDGVIRVNRMTYPDIAAMVELNLPWGYGLYADADEDGSLSAEELAAPLASY